MTSVSHTCCYAVSLPTTIHLLFATDGALRHCVPGEQIAAHGAAWLETPARATSLDAC